MEASDFLRVRIIGLAARARRLARIDYDSVGIRPLNGSQALGARLLDLSAMTVDAFISVGFKWLCGPYGTGFVWIAPEFRDRLRSIKAYWLAMQTAEDLEKSVTRVELREDLGARAYDVFGTANFFNFVPFAVAVEHLTKLGLERIRDHDQALVSRFVDGLEAQYTVTSPKAASSQRSTLVFFSHQDKNENRAIHQALLHAGVHVAFRGGSMRLAPHLYNGAEDIDRALQALHSAARRS